ncbi:hypothetical protein AQUCO_00900162v1 [Aquilegia coerulea]|uniref:Uncharacterized protein n=1 Tax=Aquilegia coerulea TaxID=218851 RepID=A0A2G5ECA4_AQUCA|nr:hypothetical protein AQUCO_00900162v1 [Aquilegia coerulea]
MGRGRGKGKKLTAVSSHDDTGSGGEEILPAHKRRGRPQKPLKDDIDDEEIDEKMEKIDIENEKSANLNKERKPAEAQIGKKRRRPPIKENPDSIKEENGVSTDNIKTNGFRQNGSRRKSKPRRAAEAGVDCK